MQEGECLKRTCRRADFRYQWHSFPAEPRPILIRERKGH
jgi:hypothetical protein